MVAFATDELEMRLDSSAAAGTRLAVESPCSPQIPPSSRRAVGIVQLSSSTMGQYLLRFLVFLSHEQGYHV